MSEKTKRKEKGFSHEVGQLVLVKWDDGMVYFAKIKRIDWRKRQCVVIFDDKSNDRASFSQIHSVDETTTDIICIKCKRDNSEFPNEIVLCDGCGIGFHQKCHSPAIPASALELDNPWKCTYCQRNIKNPFLTESIDAMQSLFEEDAEESASTDESIQKNIVIKQEVVSDDEQSPFQQPFQQSSPPRKRKGRLNENKRIQPQANKRRPLQVLRRKFAKSRLGRNTSSSSNLLKKAPEAQEKQMNDLEETETSLSLTESPAVKTKSFFLRKRTLESRNINLNNSSTADEECCSNDSEDEVINEEFHDDKPRPRKRPRSLRVSLTLPPSVETTPITMKTNPMNSIAATPITSTAIDTSLFSVIEEKETNSCEQPMPSAPDTNLIEEAIFSAVSTSSTVSPENEGTKASSAMKNTTDSAAVQPLVSTPTAISHNDSFSMEVPSSAVTTIVSTVSGSSTSGPTTVMAESSSSLVKISPGVTQLRPTKHKRPTVISDTALPVCTSATKLSPLEQLRFDIASKKSESRAMSKTSLKTVTQVTDSCATTVMQSMGTITSAPPIQSSTTQQHHHSRKSSAPSRAISLSMSAVTPLHKQKPRRNSNPIVISPSPSPPLSGSQLVAVTNQADYRGHPAQYRRRDDRVWSDSRSKGTMTAECVPVLKHNQTKGYLFHHTLPHQTKNVPVQTEPLHHVAKEPVKQPHQLYSTKYHQIVQPTTPQEPNQHSRAHSSQQAPAQLHGGEHQHYRTQYVAVADPAATYGNKVRSPTALFARHTTNPPQYHAVVQNDAVRVLTTKPMENTALYTLVSAATPSQIQHTDTIARGTVMSVPAINQAPSHTDPAMSVIRVPVTSMVDAESQFPQRGNVVYGSNSSGSSAVLHQPPILTTKPYAVVNAIPTQSTNVKRPSPPVYSPPASLKFPPPTKKIVDGSVQSYQDASQMRARQDIAHIREEATSDLTQCLHGFSNKYKDFDTLSANELMGIFHGALKKFQKSSKVYDSYTSRNHHSINTTGKVASPNVNIRSYPVTNTVVATDLQTQTQQVCHAADTPVVFVSQPSPPKYETALQQQQSMIHQPALTQQQQSSKNRTYQVHTTGVFVPPSDNNSANSVYKSQPAQQQHQVVSRVPATVQQIVSSHRIAVPPVSTQQQLVTTVSQHQQQSNRNIVESSVPVPGSQTVKAPASTEKRRRKPEAPSNIHHIRTMHAHNVEKHFVNRNQDIKNSNSSSGSDPTPNSKRVCASCGKHATFLCSGCHKIWYCGRDCQVKSWDQHATSCKS